MTHIAKTITLRNQLVDLDKIKALVSDLTCEVSCLGKVDKEIFLVLEELFVNVLNYGFIDDQPHEITLSLTCEEGTLTIQMEDDGKPFDITAARPPVICCPIEERKLGGLGIELVKHFTDHCEYRRKNGKNIVRIKKDYQGLKTKQP